MFAGVTNDLERRIIEHSQKTIPGFTARYNLYKLVYYEATEEIMSAIEREKQIKGWTRRKKAKLVTGFNPKWKDLSKSILNVI